MVLASTPLKRMAKIEMELGKLTFLVPNVVIGELRNLRREQAKKVSDRQDFD